MAFYRLQGGKEHGVMSSRIQRSVAILGAATNIGIRPHDSARGPRRLDLAPAALRDFGLVARLGARDLGDVTSPPYRDFRRPPKGIRNEAELVDYNRALADRIASSASLERSGLLDIPGPLLEARRPSEIAAVVLERVTRQELEGFWIHFDADLLDPVVMPAVDSPEPGGPNLDHLAELLAPLVQHPKAIGMQVTIYDPALDLARVAGARLVEVLASVFAPQLVEV
jgi:arginase